MQLSVPRFCLNFRDLPSASSHPQMSTTFYAGQNWNQEPRIQNQVFFVDGRGLSSWAATYCFPECTNRKLGSKVDPEPNANTLTPDVRVASDKLQVVSQFLHQMPALMSIALFLLISFFPLLEISMWPPLVHGVHGRSRPLLLQFYFGLYIQPFSHTCAPTPVFLMVPCLFTLVYHFLFLQMHPHYIVIKASYISMVFSVSLSY